MSTIGRSIRLAFRIRVSMSAIGSVIMARLLLPAGLLDAGDQAEAGHVPEADAADAELPVDRPRPAADPAAQPDADHLAGLHLDLAFAVLLQAVQVTQQFDSFGVGRHSFRWSVFRLCGFLLTPRGTACRTRGAIRGPRRRCSCW